ncbi:MAG: hypothetical protein ACI8Z5_000991, partial [Lentimonas sp.]
SYYETEEGKLIDNFLLKIRPKRVANPNVKSIECDPLGGTRIVRFKHFLL